MNELKTNICGTMSEIKNGLILFARGGAKKQ